MENFIKKLKKWFSSDDDISRICFEWDEDDNAQYERFAVEHFEECGSPTPWICFKYVGNKLFKKFVCPVCKAEIMIKK